MTHPPTLESKELDRKDLETNATVRLWFSLALLSKFGFSLSGKEVFFFPDQF